MRPPALVRVIASLCTWRSRPGAACRVTSLWVYALAFLCRGYYYSFIPLVVVIVVARLFILYILRGRVIIRAERDIMDVVSEKSRAKLKRALFSIIKLFQRPYRCDLNGCTNFNTTRMLNRSLKEKDLRCFFPRKNFSATFSY